MIKLTAIRIVLCAMAAALCASCLTTRHDPPVIPGKTEFTVLSGKAAVKFFGQVNEDVYAAGVDGAPTGGPVMKAGTITRNETKEMGRGDTYTFSVAPSEVVTVNVKSLDGKDVEVLCVHKGRERLYTVKGSDKMGLMLAFQSR